MDTTLGGLLTTVILGAAISGCGELGPDGTQAPEPVVERQGALGAFAGWTLAPNGLIRYGAAVAGSDSAGVTLVGVGTDNDVYTSNSLDPGGLGGLWRRSSNFGLAGLPVGFLPTISAVGFTGESAGALQNTIAIAYVKSNQGGPFIRIQNTTGTVVVHDWDLIPTPSQFFFVSLAWAPQSSLAGATRTLYLFASAPFVTPQQIYMSSNTLTGGVYNHANWTPFTPVPIPGGSTFANGGFDDVQAAWACPPTSSDYSLVLAVTQFISPSPSNQAYFSRFSATQGWTPYQLAQNGVVYGSLGLAAGCSATSHEMSLFGTGTDEHIYVTTQIGGGPAVWSPVGTQTFRGFSDGQDKPGFSAARAGSSGGNVWVTATDRLVPFYNSAPGAPTTSCLVNWQNNTTCAPLCLSRTQSDQRACQQVLNCYRDSHCGPGTCDTGNQVCGPNVIGAGNAPYPYAQQVFNCIPGCT